MFDFNQVIDRLNTDSVKWNGMNHIYQTDDLLPMWVADMDFAAPNAVKEAIINRAEHGIFGYSIPSAQFHQTIKNWVQKRYLWEIQDNWIIPSPGVVTGIAFAIQALTNEGDQVLLQSPVYTPFFSMIENNNRVVVNNQLVLKNNRYEIDFADLEEKLRSGVKLMILCSPHNPVGRVWTQDELKRIGELCRQNHVYLISDEIHADIIHKPHVHMPVASIDKNIEDITITFIAPSKTFNIPGLQASIMIIPNEEIRNKVQKVQGKIGFHGLNLFGNIALDTAYSYGEEWLEQLLEYLQSNVTIAIDFIARELPNIKIIQPEGTYLLWLDCRSLGLSDDELMEVLITKGKLALEPGKKFGSGGEGFLRMNIGCTRSTLEEGLKRLKKAFS